MVNTEQGSKPSLVRCELDGTACACADISAGDFYTNQAIQWPATVTLKAGEATATLPDAPRGSCNDCHGASNRIHIP